MEKQNEEEMDILSGSTYLNYIHNYAIHHRPRKFLIVNPEKRSCGILCRDCSKKENRLICFFNLFWPKLAKVNPLIHTAGHITVKNIQDKIEAPYAVKRG